MRRLVIALCLMLAGCSSHYVVPGSAVEADGPVVMGKLKGSGVRQYIPFSDVAGEARPVIATQGYVDSKSPASHGVTVRAPGGNNPDLVAPNTFIISKGVAANVFAVTGSGWKDGDTLEILSDVDVKVTNANNIYYGGTTTNSLNIGAKMYYKFIWFNEWLWLTQYNDTSSPRAN